MNLNELNVGTPVELQPMSANDLLALFNDDVGLSGDPTCTLCSFTCSSATAA